MYASVSQHTFVTKLEACLNVSNFQGESAVVVQTVRAEQVASRDTLVQFQAMPSFRQHTQIDPGDDDASSTE